MPSSEQYVINYVNPMSVLESLLMDDLLFFSELGTISLCYLHIWDIE